MLEKRGMRVLRDTRSGWKVSTDFCGGIGMGRGCLRRRHLHESQRSLVAVSIGVGMGPLIGTQKGPL